MAGRDNAVALAGKRAARRAAAAVIALVAVLSLLLAYLLLSTGTLTALVGMPGWQRVLLSLVFGAGFVALFGALYRFFERRQLDDAGPTPVSGWATLNRWKYRAVEDDLDESVWQAAFPDAEDVDAIAESVSGQWEEFEARAFVFTGFHGRYQRAGEAVVMRVPTSWEGAFCMSRDKRLVDDPVNITGRLGANWHVGGDDSPAMRRVLADKVFSAALASSSLPKQTLVSVNGAYAVVEARWTSDTKTLECCLNLLAALVRACQSATKGRHR